MNYNVEQQKFTKISRNKEIPIYNPIIKYATMFKYHNSYWCYSLPLQQMYLMSINDAIKCIEKQQKFNIERNFKCEYKIIEFIN